MLRNVRERKGTVNWASCDQISLHRNEPKECHPCSLVNGFEINSLNFDFAAQSYLLPGREVGLPGREVGPYLSTGEAEADFTGSLGGGAPQLKKRFELV